MINWNYLTNPHQLDELKKISSQYPVLVYKHSTRCSISSIVLSRLERSWNGGEIKSLQPYFLDLIAHRSLSHEIAHLFEIQHESPQILLIINGTCAYHTSHSGINYQTIREQLEIRTAS